MQIASESFVIRYYPIFIGILVINDSTVSTHQLLDTKKI